MSSDEFIAAQAVEVEEMEAGKRACVADKTVELFPGRRVAVTVRTDGSAFQRFLPKFWRPMYSQVTWRELFLYQERQAYESARSSYRPQFLDVHQPFQVPGAETAYWPGHSDYFKEEFLAAASTSNGSIQ